MLLVTAEEIQRMEERYPGISEQIHRFEQAELPSCTTCGSDDTSSVQCGVIGRTISISTATTKFKLIPNKPTTGPSVGDYYCRSCETNFDVPVEPGD